jgi:hypothetical protein
LSLQFELQSTNDVLSKAYQRTPLAQAEIERLRTKLNQLLKHLDDIGQDESEEHIKRLVATFLTDVWYKDDYYINTSQTVDLAIGIGPKAKDPLGVLIEAKKPGSREFPTLDRPNTKALQELLLYYLRQREAENHQICHLVLTNGWDWYLINENWWASNCWQDRKLVEDFRRFEADKGKTTADFYREIAAPFFDRVAEPMPVTHINLRDYQALLNKQDLYDEVNSQDQRKATAFFKLLSPQHLLKQGHKNVGNSLDRGFYLELLHILGLQEITEAKTGKLLITQLPEGQRLSGSVIENAIRIIQTNDELDKLPNPKDYGIALPERLFNVGVELVITWLNRVLFLKLLEAQLIKYHRGAHPPGQGPNFAFLSPSFIADYDELNKLFFRVLAVLREDREPEIIEKFGHIPYLNSSLFEISDLERNTIKINSLDSNALLPIMAGTVLRDQNGNKATGKLPALQYLLRFLDAYNFSSEGGGEIQAENKTLINAKVLGLFFEKINGYKDGSIYTPGYITEYMCRENLLQLVVEKFSEAFDVPFESYQELRSWSFRAITNVSNRLKANGLINELRVCDPAVGSGHYLVSALNEIIAIKSELGVLGISTSGSLLEVNVEILEDELVVIDRFGNDINYTVQNKGLPFEVQRTLFHEKQYLIETCLFGVDINPNSVKICRLRLWIELLKNAYYDQGELQTLPNIDINIKEGNSLLSRIPLRTELVDPKMIRRVDEYRGWVKEYKQTTDKERKRGLVQLINSTTRQLGETLAKTDPRRLKINAMGAELYKLTATKFLDTTPSDKRQAQEAKKIAALEAAINNLTEELQQEENGAIYRHAFEWRFAFPEVLDAEANFVGFDLVIGNPPYIRQEELGELKKPLSRNYEVFAGTADIYQYFFELGVNLCRKGDTNVGAVSYITANKWMRAAYGQNLRQYMQRFEVSQVIDFGDLRVFDNATTYPAILSLRPRPPKPDHTFLFTNPTTLSFGKSMAKYIRTHERQTIQANLSVDGWNLSNNEIQTIISKIKNNGLPLGDFINGKSFIGIKTALNKAFILSKEAGYQLLSMDEKNANYVRPILFGKDIKAYSNPNPNKYVIIFPKGISKNLNVNASEEWFKTEFPDIFHHLIKFKDDAISRTDKGDFWWELRACDYYNEFAKEKIIFPDISKSGNFTIDNEGAILDMTAFCIGKSEKWLVAILNSQTIRFFFESFSSQIRGGYLRWKRQYVSQIPIIEPKPAIKRSLTKLVDKIMALPADNLTERQALEAQIDVIVAELYGVPELLEMDVAKD